MKRLPETLDSWRSLSELCPIAGFGAATRGRSRRIVITFTDALGTHRRQLRLRRQPRFIPAPDATEAYFALPGSYLSAIEQSLAVIVGANKELEKLYRARAATPSA